MRQELMHKEQERLKSMVFYCTIPTCLRRYMLEYFGETTAGYCGKCSNCLTKYKECNVYEEAVQIIDCIKESGQRFGKAMIVDILRGHTHKKIISYQLNELSSYGSTKEYSRNHLYEVIQHLLYLGILKKSDDGYSVLTIDHEESLPKDKRLMMKIVIEKQDHKPVDVDIVNDTGLFEYLRKTRLEIARKAKIPPYLVFSDKTLHEMCKKKPRNKVDMLRINGVGEVKYDSYGEYFIKAIKAYVEGF